MHAPDWIFYGLYFKTLKILLVDRHKKSGGFAAAGDDHLLLPDGDKFFRRGGISAAAGPFRRGAVGTGNFSDHENRFWERYPMIVLYLG